MRNLKYYKKKWSNQLKNIRIRWFKLCRRLTFGRQLSKVIRNSSVSIISQNCIGGVIAHDAGLRFNSPTINMWIPAHEFILLVSDLETNLKGDLKDITTDEGYPLGLLNNKIHIHFIHYKNFEDVKDKWKSRLKRVNYDNIRIIMTENDGCSYEDLEAFERLPYEKKVVFTHKPYPEFNASFYIPGFEKLGRVAYVMGWKGIFGARRCDKYDWAKFLND